MNPELIYENKKIDLCPNIVRYMKAGVTSRIRHLKKVNIAR